MILYTTEHFAGFPDGDGVLDKDVPVSLISDNHWYWWYVRVLHTGKDQFVPADIVELPQERIARLNSIANEHIEFDTKAAKKQSKPKKSVKFTGLNAPELTSDSESDSSVPCSPIYDTFPSASIPDDSFLKGMEELTIQDLDLVESH